MTRREEQTNVAALELLAQASAYVAESLEYPETLRRIAQSATPKFADAVLIYLYENGALTRHELAADDETLRRRVTSLWDRYPPSTERLQRIVDTKEAWIEESLSEESFAFITDPEHRAALREIAIRSLIAVPMIAGNTPFGVLLFARVGPDRPFTSFEADIARQLAQRAASAIERSRIYMSEREQRTRLEHLQTLTEALATAVTIEATSDAVITEMRELLGATVVVIGLCSEDGKQLHVLRTAGVADNIAEKYRTIPMAVQLPLTEVARTGEPVWLGTRELALARSAVFRDAPDSNAWAAIPLVVPGSIIGVLGLSFRDPQPFPEDVRSFILSMGHQTAQALERARLFESERTARREAERASHAKDEFLAILSHELRTPLTTVLGWSDLLKMTYQGPDDSIRFAIESLRASAATQARLIDDLLDVTRIITGKLSIEIRPCELTEVVRIGAESMRLTAETKGLTLEVDALCCIDIDADPARLHQMVTNLVGNAIKFTPPGGTVRVVVRRDGDEATIEVSDTGIGITSDFLPHVFERFRQASIGDSRTHSGLGLGLSIVQHLAQLHSGSVRADSPGQGKGATFTVTLPVRR